MQEYEQEKKDKALQIENKQLINLYSVGKNKYSVSIIYLSKNINKTPKIPYILNLIAEDKNGKITFSIPLDYLTRYWKTQLVGNTTYHFRNKLNLSRAKLFDDKHKTIANKLGVAPEQLEFFMCDNRQESLKLQGFDYSAVNNGQTRGGYGVDVGTIFSVMNNEDFSHDVFHYYSGKVNEIDKRNWISEEGIAYSWGNAYYTDMAGEMITHKRLVQELKQYLKDHSDIKIFDLFEKNAKIFKHIAPEPSARSTISGLIVNKVERKRGMKGLTKLINCGRKDLLKDYLKATNELLGINQHNFDKKVRLLLKNYN